MEVLPRTRRNHGCDNHRRTQEGSGGRRLPQIPQPLYPEPDHVSYEAEVPRQRSLPRTPRERKPGAEQVRPSSQKSPKRTASALRDTRVDQLVPDPYHQHHHHPRGVHEGTRSAAEAPRKPHRHSKPECSSGSEHRGHRSGRTRSEGGQRTRSGRSRMRRQSPVEERLSVHEDDSMSDAFDDDGLFQIDENFAKFLDDKTSCQK